MKMIYFKIASFKILLDNCGPLKLFTKNETGPNIVELCRLKLGAVIVGKRRSVKIILFGSNLWGLVNGE
jgi:hypothetical protein